MVIITSVCSNYISGNKKEKQGSEVLTMLLQALKNIVRSNSLPVQKILVGFYFF